MDDESGNWIQRELAKDPRDIERRMLATDRMRAEQSLVNGALAGLVASMVGAGGWALVSALTHFQIGWMAVGVAALTGFAIRFVGKGIDPQFGYVGAALALWGCVLGNYLFICNAVASNMKVSFLSVVASLGPFQAFRLIVTTLSPYDVLFYGIALFAGYRSAIRPVTEADILRTVGP